MKHLKHGSQTLAKKHMKTLEKAIENIYNIQIKYLQHMCEIYATSK
jgi:oligoribonuclease NrnB/cAMP/cGMP phosphodiesterase (DHH superfamily)